MTTQKKLLILVDGSERAIHTVDYVKNFMPVGENTRIVLFHVFSGLPKEYRELEKEPTCAEAVHQLKNRNMEEKREIRAYLELMEKARESIITTYQEKTGMERDQLMAMLTAETYLDANEAVEKGFADEVTEQLAVAAHGTLPEFTHVPADVAVKMKSLEKEPEMADQTPNEAGTPERIPASIQQLKAMPGVDAEFIAD